MTSTVANEFDVTLDMEPPTVTHHAKKIKRFGTRLGLGDSDRLKAAKQLYHYMLVRSMKRPPEPLDGPVRLDITFCFGGAAATEWYTVKPDRDNAEKTLVDALVAAGFIRLDQRVCCGDVVKIRGPRPYVRAVGRVLTEPPLAVSRVEA